MIQSNVFLRELRLGRRSLIIWTGVVVLFVAIYLGFFPIMQDPDMAKVVEAYPEAIKQVFNLTGVMFTDVNLYHAGIVLPYILLLTSIFALMLAGSLVSRDADLGTAEFLYTKPVTRNQLLASKVSAFLVMLTLLWAITFVTSTIVGFMAAGNQYRMGLQLPVHLAGLVATVAAGGLAFALAPFINQVQGTTYLGVGVGLGFFLLHALSGLSARLENLRYLTLYYYADFRGAATGEPFIAGMAALLAVFLAGTGLGFLFLNRKEFTG
ncbi:MAG: ABC transporter permease subunit [Bacillota bacterium]